MEGSAASTFSGDGDGDAELSSLSRVERKRQAKVRLILITTAELLQDGGYHALSLEDVADRVDLSKGSLYHYFSGKDELVAAALDLVAGEVNQRLVAVSRQFADSAAPIRLRALLREQLRILLLDYDKAGRPFLQPLEWPAELRQLIRSHREQHDAIFRSVIDEGIAGGYFFDDETALIRHCIFGAVNFVPVWASSLDADRVIATIEPMVETLMRLVERPG